MDKYKRVEKLLSNYKMMKISIENLEKEIEHLKSEDGVKGINGELYPEEFEKLEEV